MDVALKFNDTSGAIEQNVAILICDARIQINSQFALQKSVNWNELICSAEKDGAEKMPKLIKIQLYWHCAKRVRCAHVVSQCWPIGMQNVHGMRMCMSCAI